MASPIQLGDIVTFAKLAWKVYHFGWADDLNAARQYTEFFRDVKGLAESLDLLSAVVSQALSSLRSEGAANPVVRWDRDSLSEIVGHYDATLEECYDLILVNERYCRRSNPLRNIEWHVLLQPKAEQLRQRILLHNSKVLHFLKPFEIDLLCRIRQDVDRMHRDLACRINSVHRDLHRLIGILVPDLDDALRQQSERQVYILDIPPDIDRRLWMAAVTGRPECGDTEDFELQDLSDAFIVNYNRSTVNFVAGLVVADRTPPVDAYLNLLKCIWILQKMKASPALAVVGQESHWPSYTRQLEDDLSSQCTRFLRDLVQPEISTANVTPDMYLIWPEKEQPQLVDVVTRDEIMEKVLDVPLQSSLLNVKRGLKLLRRLGSGGSKFRMIVDGEEQTANARRRQQTEVIDFDLSSVVIEPQYALPWSNVVMPEIILQRDERIARLTFTSMSHIAQFQQCITGFKLWAGYSQYNAVVKFVVGGCKEPVEALACIQLWIPKLSIGSIVTSNNLATEGHEAPAPSTSSPSTTLAPRSTPTSAPLSQHHNATSSAQENRRCTMCSSSLPLPNSSSLMPSITSHARSMSVWSEPEYRNYQRPGHLASLHPLSPSGFGHIGSTTASSTGTENGSPVLRSTSVSSAVLNGASRADTSSRSDGHSVIVATGRHKTGIIHRSPLKPMLVIFAESQTDHRRYTVSVQIDEETAINPGRCNCRHGSACMVAAIEQRKGAADLEACRFEHSGLAQGTWNIAPLSVDSFAPFNTTATWRNVKRVTITFPQPEDRIRFGGHQCHCRIETEGDLTNCLRMHHRGLWGEVHEFYRRQSNAYHKARFGHQPEVVNGLADA